MRNRFFFLAATSVMVTVAAAQQGTIERLDGSKITSQEIDATVTRVMQAAEVTGVGIAIFDKGKIV